MLDRSALLMGFVGGLPLKLVERQLVQSAVHIQTVVDVIANAFKRLEHNNRVWEPFDVVFDDFTESVERPLSKALPSTSEVVRPIEVEECCLR